MDIVISIVGTAVVLGLFIWYLNSKGMVTRVPRSSEKRKE